MAFWRNILGAALFSAALLSGAHAETPGVKQSGHVTPGHITTWTTDGVVQDGGTATDPKITGGLGVKSTNQNAICTQNGATGGAISSLCLGVTPTEGDITLQNQGGGAALPLYIWVNGVKYPFPGPSAVGPMLNAVNFGVKADGVTSDDAAMKNAIAACAQQGAALWLPPGKILLNGSAGTIPLSNCGIIGSGVTSGTFGQIGTYGTTLYITGTGTFPVFTIGNSWSAAGINAYWPNQTTGTTVYPALFGDANSAAITGFWYLDHVALLNCYDCIVLQGGGGNWKISNANIYAVHDAIRMAGVGDSAYLDNIHFTPGNWWSLTNGAYLVATDYAATVNKIFHITAPGGVSLTMTNIGGFDWRHVFYLDSGATMAISNIDIYVDGASTQIDTSSGGAWAAGNNLRMQGTCYRWISSTATIASDHAPCFNLGANGTLQIDTAKFTTMQGSFIETAGASLELNNVNACGYGRVADGSDYYGVHVTASPGGGVSTTIQNSKFCGQSDTHTHGFNSGSLVTPKTVIQNTTFGGMNDAVVLVEPLIGSLTGNVSYSTQGTVSAVITGTNSNNGIVYATNNWDKPPAAAVSSCGAGATGGGTLGGTIFVGSTVTTTACTLTLPFVPKGGNGNCNFTPGTTAILAAGPTLVGSTVQWAISSNADLHGSTIFFNCPGAQ